MKMYHEGSEVASLQEEASVRREAYRWKDGRPREQLPIDFYLPEIVEAVHHNQITIVQAETGVGKTTRISQALLDSDPDARIIMTQTRRPAVRMNGSRIAEEMGSAVGDTVGWRLRYEEPQLSENTRLTLLIDQSVANQIRKDGKLPDGILIIDEAHERSLQLDILLALVKEYLPNSPNTRVVITSATIDTQKFQQFYDSSEPIHVMAEKRFPVETRVERLQYGEHHTEGAIRAMKGVLDQFASGMLTIPSVDPESTERNPVSKGAFTMLLPGKDDIRQAHHELEKYAKELGIADRIQLMDIHGQSERDDIEAIRQPVTQFSLRVNIATELLRSSITTPETIGVIDSLQVKRQTTDANGVTHLRKVAVAGAEADQGKGRSGRERPGIYIPISFQQEYEEITDRGSNEYWPQPAIQREALSSVVLQIAAAGLDMRTLPMLDKPDSGKINVALKRLQQLDALDERGQITEKGRRLVEFPIEPERAQVLLEAEKRGVLPEAIIAMSVLENEGITFVPRKDTKSVVVTKETLDELIKEASKDRYYFSPERFITKPLGNGKFALQTDDFDFPLEGGARAVAGVVWKQFAGETGSDFYAAIQAFRAYKAEQNYLAQNFSNPNEAQRRLQVWCQEHFLNYKKLQLVDSTCLELRDEAQEAQLQLDAKITQQRAFDHAELMKSLLSGLIDGISVRDTGYFRGDNNYRGPKSELILISNLSACQSKPSVVLTEGVRKSENSDRYMPMYFSEMASPIQPDWLLEVLPQLCTTEVDREQLWFDQESGTVRGARTMEFNGYKVEDESVAITGPEAIAKLADVFASPRQSLYNDMRLSFAFENEYVMSVLQKLYIKSKGEISEHPFTQEYLKEWYREKLSEKGIDSLSDLMAELNYEESDFSLEMNSEDFVSYEDAVRINREHPDEIAFGENAVHVSYDYRDGEFIAAVVLRPQDALAVTSLPKLPSGESLTITIRSGRFTKTFDSNVTIDEVQETAREYLSESELEAKHALKVHEVRMRLGEVREQYYVLRNGASRHLLGEQSQEVQERLERAWYMVNERPEEALKEIEVVNQLLDSTLEQVTSRYKSLHDYRELPIDQALEIVHAEEKKDIGKYRLVVAGVASRGIEGLEALLAEGIGIQTKTSMRTDTMSGRKVTTTEHVVNEAFFKDMEKTLDKVVSENRSNPIAKDRDVQDSIDTLKKQMNIYQALIKTLNDPMLSDNIGDDNDARRMVRAEVYNRLMGQHSEVTDDMVRAILPEAVDSVLEAMTS